MGNRALGSVVNFLHRRIKPSIGDEPDTDGELLARFAMRRDEAAFAMLMHRHGPMVLGVCRRVLTNTHDADDAFQATFLILVRKAGSLRRPELVGNWLYGVAYRTAVRVRAQTVARNRREGDVMHELPAPPAEDAAVRELRSLLDAELNRLPEKYRRPFVLCHLEGLTNEEAARRLGCPKGTVLSRLSRARERLRRGLERRGVTVTATALTALLAEYATAALPITLFDTTLTSALLFASGQAAVAGTMSAPAVAIAEGVLKTMQLAKLKIAVVLLVLAAAAGSGAGMLIYGPGESVAAVQETKKIEQKSDTKKADKAQPAAKTEAIPKPEPAQAKDANRRASYLIDRLASRIDFPGFDDPKLSLEAALDHLADKYDLTFEFDDAAFKEAGYQDKSVLLEPIAQQPIPRMRSVSVATVLRKILSRITTRPGHEASYMIRPDHILIATRNKARSEAFGDRPREVPLISVVLDKRPLGEGLLELAGTEGLNVIIDPRVEEKARTAVSATLLNVPADTAVRVLADMADLKPAFVDNVIYVTSKDNAKRLEQEPKKRPMLETGGK